MKRWISLALLAAPLAVVAAPFQPSTIPAEAKWYLHGDLTELRKTTTGSTLIKEIRNNEASQLAEIENLFKFDPLTDLTDVVLFGNGRENHAAIILSGNMDRAHLEGVIVQADDYETSAHGDATLHHWEDDGKTQHAAFHGEKTVIISEQKDLVTLALDVLAAKKPSLKLKTPLPFKKPVIVAFAHLSEIDMPIEEGSRLVRKAESLLITFGERDERLLAELSVDTKTEKAATQLMHILEGIVSLGELAEEGIEDLGIQHQGKAEGKTMTMSVSLSAAKTLALLSEFK